MSERPNRKVGRRGRNVLALLLLVVLPLQGSIQGATSGATPASARVTLDPPSATSGAATTPKLFMKLDKHRVTTKQRAQVKVALSARATRWAGTGARQSSGLGSGEVKVVAKGGGKSRPVRAQLVAGKATVSLPRLPNGIYRVRAKFLGNDLLGKAKSPYRRLTVVAGGDVSGPSGWPGAGNTGVPDGTTLTTYSGPCTIAAAGTVIDAKSVTCATLLVQAANVSIRKSKVRRIIVDTDVNRTWSLTITDSEVDAGGGDWSAISNGNVTIVRADIHGGHNGVECQEHASYCAIRDSWIHDQWRPPSGDVHMGGLLAMGNQVPCTGTNGACVEIVHNTIVCDAPVNGDGGGCTGDINLLPQWGPMPGAIVRNNYLGANVGSAYCTYGGAGMEFPATNIVYRDNVFQRGTNRKCAAYGPVTNFDSSASGNVWSNNRYDDGTVVSAAR